MNPPLLPLAAALALGLGLASPLSIAQQADPNPAPPAADTTADPKAEEAAKKAREEEAQKKEEAENQSEETLKKEAEPLTRRLKGDTAGKLWELVQKGDDTALKATGLPAATLEVLKTERPNLKGLHSLLANEKLGKDTLKQLVAYGNSSKFAKLVEEEAKEKEKAEKERIREKKKARKERD